MSRAFTGFLAILLGMIGGAGVGYAYAWYRIELSIARMREQSGWVCRTGIDMPLYFWTPIGAIAGMAAAIFVVVVIRHVRRRNEQAREMHP